MAYNNINNLLDKYWEGTTSLQEEQVLHDYFNSDEVSQELKQYQPLFQFFKVEKENQLPNNFETEVLQKLAPTVPKPAKIRKLYYNIMKSAAVVLVLVASYFTYSTLDGDTVKHGQSNMIVYDSNPEDAEAAYAAYRDALKLVSRKIDKGTNKAKFGLGQVKKATSIIK